MSVIAELRHEGATLHLTLNAPKANILDLDMMGAIQAALDAHVGDSARDPKGKALRALVFEGAGAHFSMGASVEEHTAERAGDMLNGFHALFRRLSKLAIPTVALVRGYCLGGGMELASWCTWIAAAPGSKFGQPEINLAVFPPMASVLLPWRLGGGHAMDLCISGRIVDAAEAHRMGLVTAVTDDLASWWENFYATHLAKKSAIALRFAERAVRRGLEELIGANNAKRTDERLDWLERLYRGELMQTHDANEGIAAFIEKREPAFSHD